MSTYAVIDVSTGIVVNTIALNAPEDWTPPDGYIVVQTDTASIGWTYSNGVFTPPPEPTLSDAELSYLARQQREMLLRSVYDPGILMAQRALRMAATPEEISYANGKIAELDEYAEALVAIPDQIGFPQTIIWPIEPTK